MELELNAKIRQDKGNKLKALREKGFIPAIVYGAGHKPVSIQVDYQEFRKVFEEAGESTVIKLKTDKEEKNVLIHDVARDPVHDKFIHVDFYQVRMDKIITAEVPLIFEGEAPAVKSLEGVLIKDMTELEVEALPKDLPHDIKIDISSLETFDDQIRVKDLKVPEGVKILTEQDDMIASVKPPRTEKELEELEEKPEEEVEPVAEAEAGEEIEEAEEKAEEPIDQSTEKVEEVEKPEQK